MAVPGSVHSPASVGTNALLADGCAPVRDADDVLAALELVHAGSARAVPRDGAPSRGDGSSSAAGVEGLGGRALSRRARAPSGAGRVDLDAVAPGDRAMLDAVDPSPTSIESVVVRTAAPLGAVAAALERLASAGLVVGGDGWWERVE